MNNTELIKSVALVYKDIEGQVQILVVKRAKHDGEQAATKEGWWEFPGGGVQAHELPAEALKRELFEETQIKNFLKIEEAVYRRKWVWEGKEHESIYFACEVDPDTEPTLNQAEHVEFRWCTISEALALLTYEGPKECINSFFASQLTY